VHLLLRTSPLEPPSGFLFSEFAPSLGLPKPPPTIRGISPRTLAVHQFHRAAICKIAHGILPHSSGGMFARKNSEEKGSGADVPSYLPVM
jgi:hypothetical protein